MPVEFLSDEQAARYGQYHADPSPEQLTQFFYLSAADKQFLAPRRLPHTRLGCAVQLGTLRFLGTFLVDPLQVPPWWCRPWPASSAWLLSSWRRIGTGPTPATSTSP